MTEAAALDKFWNSFGIQAYPATAVPDDTVFPWLTYEVQSGFFGDQPTGVAVNLWYHTDSEAVPNAKVREIADAIGRGGIQLRCDNGSIWIKRGAPWCINLTDESDISIKRRQLNVTLEFNTI